MLGLRPCGFVANGQVRIYHADRLGSVRWVTDGGQNIVVSYVHEGFGKIVGQNGGGGGPYHFCGLWGYRNDWDAGLIHVGARYYEVETGRFVQKDPVFNIDAYCYVGNNPIMRVDPDGSDWLDTATNFFAGMGDAITFGATDWIRDRLGVNDVVDKDSGWYTAGRYAGWSWWAAFGTAAAAKACGYEVVFLRYHHAGGGGMNLLRGGKRVFAVDFHQWKGQPWYKWLHYHRRPGIKKHRPWEGGW